MESQNRIKKLWPHTLTLRNVLTYELTNCSHWLKEHPPVTLAIGIKSQVVLRGCGRYLPYLLRTAAEAELGMAWSAAARY